MNNDYTLGDFLSFSIHVAAFLGGLFLMFAAMKACDDTSLKETIHRQAAWYQMMDNRDLMDKDVLEVAIEAIHLLPYPLVRSKGRMSNGDLDIFFALTAEESCKALLGAERFGSFFSSYDGDGMKELKEVEYRYSRTTVEFYCENSRTAYLVD